MKQLTRKQFFQSFTGGLLALGAVAIGKDVEHSMQEENLFLREQNDRLLKERALKVWNDNKSERLEIQGLDENWNKTTITIPKKMFDIIEHTHLTMKDITG